MLQRRLKVRWVAVGTVAAVLSGGVVAASAHWHGGSYAHTTGSCIGHQSDPIGVIFHGSAATVTGPGHKYLGGDHGDINFHTGWSEHPELNNDYYANYGVCLENDDQVSQSLGLFNSRYHIRLFQQASDYAPGKHAVAGTPHHENWITYNPLPGTRAHGCGPPGDHAIDVGAVDRGQNYEKQFGPSGYDKARSYLAQHFKTPHHTIEHVYWGNTQSYKQCNGDYAGSTGTVDLISVGTP